MPLTLSPVVERTRRRNLAAPPAGGGPAPLPVEPRPPDPKQRGRSSDPRRSGLN